MSSSDQETVRLNDINLKIKLIQTVISKCLQLTLNPVKLGNSLVATMFFTNEHSTAIEGATKCPKVTDLKTISKSYQEIKTKVDAARILSSDIQDILYDYYVNKRMLLNKQTLYRELQGHDVFDLQTEILKSRGFIWRKISGDKCLLIEDPEVQAKRIKYLLDMKKFRDQDRTFVYIEEKAIPADYSTLLQFQLNCPDPESGKFQYVKIAVSPQYGLISLSINNTSQTITDWITKEIAPHLKPSFVLVYEEGLIKEAPIEEPPKPEAKKKEMIAWLELNNIPCDPTAHRADLYELINIYKDKTGDRKYLTVEIIKGINVEVVKRPRGWPALDYFESVFINALWQDVEDGNVAEMVASRLEMRLSVCDISSWQLYNNEVAMREADIFEKDMELEEVIDKLFAMAKDEDISHVDLPNTREVENDIDLEKYALNIFGNW